MKQNITTGYLWKQSDPTELVSLSIVLPYGNGFFDNRGTVDRPSFRRLSTTKSRSEETFIMSSPSLWYTKTLQKRRRAESPSESPGEKTERKKIQFVS